MSFGSDIRKYAEAKKISMFEAATVALVNTSSKVVIKTPVLTGVLANSWTPTKDIPEDAIIVSPGREAQLNSIEKTVAASIGAVYYLVNNQPYAKRVEFEGHSSKAPGGMLRIAIEEFQQELDKAINNL